MSPKVIVFDLDGTLLDTLDDLADASNMVLEECGYPQHPVEAYKYFVGDGLRVLMERIIPEDASQTDVDHCCDLFNTIYSRCWDNKSAPYAGIEEMLHQLRRSGARLTVLSNKPHQFTEIYIERFFQEHRFEVVFGQREGVNKKPDPAGALEIAELMGVSPAECMYVGDTAVDMQTGKAAGMFTVGVLWGFRDIEELQQNKADMIVKRPMEIVEYVIASG